jgi:N-acetylglucosaminyl-diphospho-decaprenol L-rhamnosyltransferase
LLISVILVSYNTAQMSIEALNCLFATQGDFNLEVFVVDNASKDNSAQIIKNAYPNITLIENKINVGFGRANNQVLDLVNGDYVLLLNTDAFVQTDTLQKTVEYMLQQPTCGILGVKLLSRDGELQPSCRYFPTPLNIFANRVGLSRLLPNIKLVDDVNWDSSLTQQCDWVPGCYYLMRKQVIEQQGLFDPIYFLYYEEVDHCFAVKKAGWQVTYFAETSVVHIGGESAKSIGKITTSGRQLNKLQVESELIYFRKNHGLVTCVLHLFLILLADIAQAIKNVLKLKYIGPTAFANTKLMLTTAWNTRMGLVPQQ